MVKTGLLLAATAAISASPATAAVTFQFDPATSFVNVDANPTICFLGGCEVSATSLVTSQSFQLDVGQSATFDFARYVIGRGFGVGSASLAAQLGFLLPSVTSASTNGAATYVRAGGFFSGGAIAGDLAWSNPIQQLTAADGSKFRVAFGGLTGAQFGSSAVSNVTVTLDSVGAVPEPATWAMMLMGFSAVGYFMRRRKTTSQLSYAV